LMDKNKLLDKVATHCRTTRTHISAQLTTNIPQFLGTLPPSLLKLLGPTLGIPNETATVAEMWERIVAMGFCAVLTHLRPRPLKKIAQELNVELNDSHSTEKHCETIVFAAYPREKVRIKLSKSLKKMPGISFSVIPNNTYCMGDMGFISFHVRNISTMRNDTERHYSPEFEFGNLRWSLLCMANKESLALYLCQQGTVHCKFVITVVNTNPDDSVFNEGTQRFSSASAENDWGFNNVVKFDYLLDPKNGFWDGDKDQISLSVGIVLVESVVKQQPAVKDQKKEKVSNEKIVQNAANQLLEAERLEKLKLKLKNDMAKLVKDEEKQRRDFSQKFSQGISQIADQLRAEQQKMTKEAAERERRELQERAREQERLRQQAEQVAEFRRKTAELNDEMSELHARKKTLSSDLKELKRSLDALKAVSAAADGEMADAQALLAERKKALKVRDAEVVALRKELQSIPRSLSPLPPESEDDGEAVEAGDGPASPAMGAAEADIMRSVQQSLEHVLDMDF